MNDSRAATKQIIVETISKICIPIVNSAIAIGSVITTGLDSKKLKTLIGMYNVKIELNNATLMDWPTTRMVESVPAAIP